MSSIAKTSISLSKKDLTKSRKTLIASRNIVFYHKTDGGETSIDLNNLSMPSEMPTQVQATSEEISGARLSIFKKNLKLVSSANGELIQGLDYLVADSYTITLIGPYETVGAEAAEIFVGSINASPMSDLTVVSTQDIVRTYTLNIGETTLNLAQQYAVGVNTFESIGAIKVWVNGVLALRDQDFQEVDSGNGYGTTIEFLSSPTSVTWQIVVDFGVRAITDTNAMDTIESLAGSVKKIADDLADVAGTSANDYLTANPSEVERRTYGDMVLDHENKLDISSTVAEFTKIKYQQWPASPTRNTVGIIEQANNLEIGKTYRITGHFYTNCGGGAAISASIQHNSVNLVTTNFETQGAIGADKMPSALTAVFTAAATTVEMYVNTINASQSIQSLGMLLEELPNHEATTQWT